MFIMNIYSQLNCPSTNTRKGIVERCDYVKNQTIQKYSRSGHIEENVDFVHESGAKELKMSIYRGSL